MDSQNPSFINFLHLNINSVSSKLDHLLNDINIFKPHIISLQETKLLKNSHFDIPGYTIFRKDISNRQGGVLIAVIHWLNAFNITDTIFDNLQFLEISIPLLNNDRINVITYYNPPPGKAPDQAAILRCKENKTILLGDLNVHHTIFGCTKTTSIGRDFLNIIENNNLHILNTDTKTRTDPRYGSQELLDYVISNNSTAKKLHNLQIIDTIDYSDHHIIFCNLKLSTRIKSNIYYRSPKNTNWDNFHCGVENDIVNLATPSLFPLTSLHHFDILAHKLSAIILKNFNTSCPLKNVTSKTGRSLMTSLA